MDTSAISDSGTEMATTTNKPDFLELYQTAHITASLRSSIASIVNAIAGRRARYEKIEEESGVPWWMVAALHQKESGMSFERHLHNGDPLTARTVQVPAGRIPDLPPPYTFEQSAVDALSMMRHRFPRVWTIGPSLEFSERYNGIGYRKRGIYSPYVWCGTQHYVRGRFVRDHVFDANA